LIKPYLNLSKNLPITIGTISIKNNYILEELIISFKNYHILEELSYPLKTIISLKNYHILEELTLSNEKNSIDKKQSNK